MSLYSRIGVPVALVAIALLGSFALTGPAHDANLGGLSFTLSGNTLLGLIAIGLAGTGTDAIARSHPRAQRGQLRRPFLCAILPTIFTAAAWVLLGRLPALQTRIMGIAATAVALALLILMEYFVANPAARGRSTLLILLQFVTYAVAAVLYGAIYPASDVTVARVVAVVSAFLAFRVLGEDELPPGRILGASLGVGLLLGGVAWLLHSRVDSAVTCSLTWVVCLYTLVGLARQFLRDNLRREVVLEYAMVGLVAFVLLFFATR